MVLHEPTPISLSAPCACAALGAITGRPWPEFRQYLGQDEGMEHDVFLSLLAKHGFAFESQEIEAKTLGSWLRLPRDPEHLFLVSITAHAIVVMGDEAVGLSIVKGPVSRWDLKSRKRIYRVGRIVEVA